MGPEERALPKHARSALSGARRASVALALVMGMTATAMAGTSSASVHAAAASGKTVAFIIKPLDNPYFGAMADGAKAAAKQYGVGLTIEAASSVTDDAGQANQLRSMVTSGRYGCYVVNPTSPTNLLSNLTSVSAKKIPVVNIDLPIDLQAAAKANVKITSYLGTNNVTAGEAGGHEMDKLLPKGSQVALIGGLPADPGSLARLHGFRLAVAGDLKVVQYVAANDDSATALADASEIMRAHPQLRGFFTVAGTMSLAIEKAVQEAGKTGTVDVIGVDGIQAQLQQVKQHLQPAAVEQFPYLMGAEGIEACVAAMNGKTVPANVPTPVLVVTKSDAADALAKYPAPPASFSFSDPFKALAG
jgi:D-allose transport system substrate-binding protein